MLNEGQAKYKSILRNLALKNPKCFDCGAKKPSWGVIHFGLFVCFECSGKHRSMGTHISFVRSTTFDQWSEQNMKKMIAGGNSKATEYFAKYGMRINKCKSHTEFYDGKVARRYKEMLEKEAQKIERFTTPEITPKSSFFSHNLDNMIEEIDTVQEPEKVTRAKPSISPSNKAADEMAAIFSNMVVSSSKPSKPATSSKKISPLSKKVVKPKQRIARVVSVAQDNDCSSEDDFEAEMEQAKHRKKPVSPESETEEDVFVSGFGPKKFETNKDSNFQKSATGEVKAVFENKYGKNIRGGPKSMTSISSSDFQQTDSTQQLQREQYVNATAIGSDAFFGRETPATGDTEYGWDDIRNEAAVKAQKLSETANSWFNSLADRLQR